MSDTRTADHRSWWWLLWLFIPGLGPWMAWNRVKGQDEIVRTAFFIALIPAFAWTSYLVAHGLLGPHLNDQATTTTPHYYCIGHHHNLIACPSR